MFIPPKDKDKENQLTLVEKNQDVDLHDKDTANIPVSQTRNIIQSYKQNPIGMFVGANLNNCTININMPK